MNVSFLCVFVTIGHDTIATYKKRNEKDGNK